MSPVRNQPSSNDLVRGVLAVPVALHDVVALDGDLADLAVPSTSSPSSSTSFISTPSIGVPIEPGLRSRSGWLNDATGDVSLQPVALEHLAAERLLEVPHDLDRERGAAGHARAQARDVGLVVLRVVEQRVVHRRHALEDRDLVALDDLERLARLEARDQRQARADADGGVEPAGLPEGVEQRQRAEQDVLLGRLGERRRARSRQFSDRLSCVSSAPFGVPVVPDV